MPEIAEREAKETSVWRFRFSSVPRGIGLRFRRGQGRVVLRESALWEVASLRSVKPWRVVATLAGSDEMVFFTPS